MVADERRLYRRALLAKGVGVGVLVAGCSGDGDAPSPTPTGTSDPDSTSVGGETETETSTSEGSALARFDYPEGTSQSGIEAGQLLATHGTTVRDAGSVTVITEGETRYENRTVSNDVFEAFDAGAVYRRDVGDQLATRSWSPADESVTYVRLDVGDRRRFRIDNRDLSRTPIAELKPLDALLAGAAWGEAREVVETVEGDAAVVYDATGVADEARLLELLSGDQVTGLEATVTVTETGYVEEVTYDLTVDRGDETVGRAATGTVLSVGETTVPEPSWANDAEREGVRFDADIRSTEEHVRLKMVNGETIPEQATVSVSPAADDRSGTAQFDQPLSVGDTLYAGFDEEGRLAADVNELPLTSTKLGERASVVVEVGRFPLFRGTVTV